MKSQTSGKDKTRVHSTKHKTIRNDTPLIEDRAKKFSLKNAGTYEKKERRITKPRQIQEQPIPSYLPKKKSSNSTAENTARLNNNIFGQSFELLLNNSKCVAMREILLENDDFDNIDDEELKLLFEHLREYSSYCALNRNYDDAEKSNKLQNRVKDELQMRATNLPVKYDSPTSYDQLYEKKMKEFQKELDDFDKITGEKRSNLEEKQKSDLEEFENRWRNDIPRKYRKPSSKLINLFEVERQLGLNGNFEKAKKVKLEADQLQIFEMQQAQRMLIRDYKIAKKQFDKTQKEEYKIFTDTRDHWRSVILARQEADINPVLNRGNVLTLKQNDNLKPKDNVYDPNVRGPVAGGGAAVYHREAHNPIDHLLLPPLLAPNDERIKEFIQKGNNKKCQKIKHAKSVRKEKEIYSSETLSSSCNETKENGLNVTEENENFQKPQTDYLDELKKIFNKKPHDHNSVSSKNSNSSKKLEFLSNSSENEQNKTNVTIFPLPKTKNNCKNAHNTKGNIKVEKRTNENINDNSKNTGTFKLTQTNRFKQVKE